MFLREIANAEIKKKNKFRFFLNSLINMCCPLNSCIRCFLPKNYIPVQESGGKLLCKIMDFPVNNTDKGIFPFYKKNKL